MNSILLNMMHIVVFLLFTCRSFINADWQPEYGENLIPDVLHHGVQIDIHSAPYTALVYADNSFPELPFCGAAIITTRHLISTAYFFSIQKHKNFKVITGSTFINYYDLFNLTKENYHTVKKIYIHEKYDPSEIYHNIALIELQDLLKLYYRVNFIPLMTLQDVYNITENAFTMILTGFGHEDIHSTSPLTEQTVQISDIRIHKLHERLLMLNRIDVKFCFGDSGNPGVINGKLAALLIYENFCNETNLPFFLTGIPYYYEWIRTYVGHERLEVYPDLS